MKSAVTAIPAAPSHLACQHFQAGFAFETDCWDVNDALRNCHDFVLLDVRSPGLFAKGHVPGAINLPHGKIIESKLQQWPEETLFVTYCAGPHCNGAARGALAGRRVRAEGRDGALSRGRNQRSYPAAAEGSAGSPPGKAGRLLPA